MFNEEAETRENEAEPARRLCPTGKRHFLCSHSPAVTGAPELQCPCVVIVAQTTKPPLPHLGKIPNRVGSFCFRSGRDHLIRHCRENRVASAVTAGLVALCPRGRHSHSHIPASPPLQQGDAAGVLGSPPPFWSCALPGTHCARGSALGRAVAVVLVPVGSWLSATSVSAILLQPQD